MDEKELLKERFKSAVSSAVKVISENYDLTIKFGNNLSSKNTSAIADNSGHTCLMCDDVHKIVGHTQGDFSKHLV